MNRHQPPLTRRIVVYYCSALYTAGYDEAEFDRMEQVIVRELAKIK